LLTHWDKGQLYLVYKSPSLENLISSLKIGKGGESIMDYYDKGYERGYEAAYHDQIYGSGKSPSDIPFYTNEQYNDFCRGYEAGYHDGRRDKGMGRHR